MINLYKGVGKKKNAVAKVFLKKNFKNKIIINNKYKINNYFNKKINYKLIFKPLFLTNSKNFTILIKAKGGGKCAQVFAICNAISKALLNYNKNFKKILSDNKLLTRDSRMVERKKVGLKKSRKKRQFSKR